VVGDGYSAIARPVIHEIVDGDTLEALAERYLGRADRALEIFEANRDVLEDPQLLPIGQELRIPPRGKEPDTKSFVPLPPLVPVPPRSLDPTATGSGGPPATG